jgi:hypothetical protein
MLLQYISYESKYVKNCETRNSNYMQVLLVLSRQHRLHSAEYGMGICNPADAVCESLAFHGGICWQQVPERGSISIITSKFIV